MFQQEHIVITQAAYNSVMTPKAKKTKRKPARTRPGKIGRLYASIEEELLSLAQDEKPDDAARWSRPLKQRICVRVDKEVVDGLKSLGPGYQTRINRILRKVMGEAKKGNAQK